MQLLELEDLGRYILLLEIKSELLVLDISSIWFCYDKLFLTVSSFPVTRFLKWAYAVTKDSLERAEGEVLDKVSGCECMLNSLPFLDIP